MTLQFLRWVFAATVVMQLSCAKELSKEQLERENRERVVERVSGSKGLFVGTLNHGGRVVPLEINVDVRTTDQSQTIAAPVVTLTTGLFGGVRVSTSEATYDSGKNELIARFKKDGKVTLELKGILSEGGFEGTLVGDTSGSHPVRLKRGNATTESLSKDIVLYQATFKRMDGTPYAHLPSVMSLRLDSSSKPAPPSFDLDRMPSLSMSFRFHGQSRVANQATRVEYNPLISQMEVALSNRVVIRFNNLGFQEGQISKDLVPEQLIGTMILDSAEVGTVEASRLPSAPALDELSPPENYVGCMTARNGELTYPVSARLTDMSKDIVNASSFLFSAAPDLRLEISILNDDGSFYSVMRFTLETSDPLESHLFFRQDKSNGPVRLGLAITGTLDGRGDPWNALTGVAQTPLSSRESSEGLLFQLVAGTVQGGAPSCPRLQRPQLATGGGGAASGGTAKSPAPKKPVSPKKSVAPKKPISKKQ